MATRTRKPIIEPLFLHRIISSDLWYVNYLGNGGRRSFVRFAAEISCLEIGELSDINDHNDPNGRTVDNV
jgi:hypothetical protein